jgi:hypothetical protein
VFEAVLNMLAAIAAILAEAIALTYAPMATSIAGEA